MLLLILESIGSTELLFILVMALVFFGPRKLPQLSRTLGKNLAEFRKASEDFKRTWEREVALEDTRSSPVNNIETHYEENSIMKAGDDNSVLTQTTPESLPAGHTVAHQTDSETAGVVTSGDPETTDDASQPESLRKQDWL